LPLRAGFLHNAAVPEVPRAMILDCPSCNARYELPESLLGPAGARVRCPSCGASFAVDPSGRRLSEPTPAPGIAVEEPPAAAPVSPEHDRSPGEIARSLIAAFIEREGDALREARDRGHLFAEWGPALLDLFEEYRRVAGPGASSSPFRDELRARLGVELPQASSD
jgi:predicted Zn finger-like uncharacterized protein